MDVHLNRTYEPLLGVRWIMDLDATLKPLYGEQEEARLVLLCYKRRMQ